MKATSRAPNRTGPTFQPTQAQNGYARQSSTEHRSVKFLSTEYFKLDNSSMEMSMQQAISAVTTPMKNIMSHRAKSFLWMNW